MGAGSGGHQRRELVGEQLLVALEEPAAILLQEDKSVRSEPETGGQECQF